VVDDKDTERFMVARDGDHFMCMFQCDVCHFRNIQRRSPREGLMKDRFSLHCIRRANLDAMWARAPSTVTNNTRQVQKLVENGKELEYAIGALLVPAGPFPVRDDQLMAVATSMLMRSLDAEINEASCAIQHCTSHAECGAQPVAGGN
jgi:hypothetical protein